jgi:hypothetical protein
MLAVLVAAFRLDAKASRQLLSEENISSSTSWQMM